MEIYTAEQWLTIQSFSAHKLQEEKELGILDKILISLIPVGILTSLTIAIIL